MRIVHKTLDIIFSLPTRTKVNRRWLPVSQNRRYWQNNKNVPGVKLRDKRGYSFLDPELSFLSHRLMSVYG